MRFWDFEENLFFDDQICFFSWSNFQKIWKSQKSFSKIYQNPSEIQDFDFRKSEILRFFENSVSGYFCFQSSKNVFFVESQNLIEWPFRNIQQLPLTIAEGSLLDIRNSEIFGSKMEANYRPPSIDFSVFRKLPVFGSVSENFQSAQAAFPGALYIIQWDFWLLTTNNRVLRLESRNFPNLVPKMWFSPLWRPRIRHVIDEI